MPAIQESLISKSDMVGRITQLENKTASQVQIDMLEQQFKELAKAFKGMAEIMIDILAKLNQLEDKLKETK